MSLLNFYATIYVSTTNFSDAHLPFYFVATGGATVSTVGEAILEYPFDGINAHGELRTNFTLDQSKTFYNREASGVYFKLRPDFAEFNRTCRTEAWSA